MAGRAECAHGLPCLHALENDPLSWINPFDRAPSQYFTVNLLGVDLGSRETSTASGQMSNQILAPDIEPLELIACSPIQKLRVSSAIKLSLCVFWSSLGFIQDSFRGCVCVHAHVLKRPCLSVLCECSLWHVELISSETGCPLRLNWLLPKDLFGDSGYFYWN